MDDKNYINYKTLLYLFLYPVNIQNISSSRFALADAPFT